METIKFSKNNNEVIIFSLNIKIDDVYITGECGLFSIKKCKTDEIVYTTKCDNVAVLYVDEI